MAPALTIAEIKRLLKHLRGLQQLDSGVKMPATALQRRFVEVCRGRAKPITPHEVAYIKWRTTKPDLYRLAAEHEKQKQIAARAAQHRNNQLIKSCHLDREKKRERELIKIARQAEERAAREAAVAAARRDVPRPRITEFGTRDDFRKDRASWIHRGT